MRNPYRVTPEGTTGSRYNIDGPGISLSIGTELDLDAELIAGWLNTAYGKGQEKQVEIKPLGPDMDSAPPGQQGVRGS